MTQQVVVLATKSDFLSSTPRTHNLSSDFHTYAVACYMYTYTMNK